MSSFSLKYAKQTLDHSLLIFGNSNLIPQEKLLSYFLQDNSTDIIAIFDETEASPTSPQQYLLKINHAIKNEVTIFDSNFPLVIDLINQQFQNKNSVSDPEAPTPVNSFSKQELQSQLSFFAKQQNLSEIHTQSLQMILDTLFANKVHINQVQWQSIAKNYKQKPVVYEFKTFGQLKKFLTKHTAPQTSFEIVENFPKYIRSYEKENAPTSESELIKLADTATFIIVNHSNNHTHKFLQIETEDTQQTAFEYFVSWITWQSPKKHLKNQKPTEYSTLFELLEAGQHVWEKQVETQRWRNRMMYAGITALIAVPSLVYAYNSLVEKSVPILLGNTPDPDNETQEKTVESKLPSNIHNTEAKVTISQNTTFQIINFPSTTHSEHRPYQLYRPSPNVMLQPNNISHIEDNMNITTYQFLVTSNHTGLFKNAIITADKCGYTLLEKADSQLLLDDIMCLTVNASVPCNIDATSCFKSLSYQLAPEVIPSEQDQIAYQLTYTIVKNDLQQNYAEGTHDYILSSVNIFDPQPTIEARPRLPFKLFFDIGFNTNRFLPGESLLIGTEPSGIFANSLIANQSICDSMIHLSDTQLYIPASDYPINDVINCLNIGLSANLTKSERFIFDLAIKSASGIIVDDFIKLVTVKDFDMTRTLLASSSYCRKNYLCDLFDYTNTAPQTNEVFGGENFTITASPAVEFETFYSGNANLLKKSANGLSNEGRAFTPDELYEALYQYLLMRIHQPTNIEVKLISDSGQLVANKTFYYDLAETVFDIPSEVYFSQSGVTNVVEKYVMPTRGNIVLIPNEIFEFSGNIIPFLKEDNCPFEPGKSEATLIIKGPLTTDEFNICIKSMVFSRPLGLFNTLQKFTLQGNIIHHYAHKNIGIGFEIHFKFGVRNFISEIGIGSVITAFLTLFAIRSYYQRANQTYANWMQTHPYGKKTATQLAFLMQIPPVLYNESVNLNYSKAIIALRKKVDELLAHQASSSTTITQTTTANSYGFDFVIALWLALKEVHSQNQLQKRNSFQNSWAQLKQRFVDDKPSQPTMEELTLLINNDLSDAEDHTQYHSALALRIVNSLLPTIKQQKDYTNALKILCRARQLSNDNDLLTYNAVRNSCYRLDPDDENYIKPPTGTYLGPKNLTVTAPSFTVKAGQCISQGARNVWQSRPQCCFFRSSAPEGYELISDGEPGKTLTSSSS